MTVLNGFEAMKKYEVILEVIWYNVALMFSLMFCLWRVLGLKENGSNTTNIPREVVIPAIGTVL